MELTVSSLQFSGENNYQLITTSFFSIFVVFEAWNL